MSDTVEPTEDQIRLFHEAAKKSNGVTWTEETREGLRAVLTNLQPPQVTDEPEIIGSATLIKDEDSDKKYWQSYFEGDKQDEELEVFDMPATHEVGTRIVVYGPSRYKPVECPGHAEYVAQQVTDEQKLRRIAQRAKPAVKELFRSKGVDLKPEEINLAASAIIRAALRGDK